MSTSRGFAWHWGIRPKIPDLSRLCPAEATGSFIRLSGYRWIPLIRFLRLPPTAVPASGPQRPHPLFRFPRPKNMCSSRSRSKNLLYKLRRRPSRSRDKWWKRTGKEKHRGSLIRGGGRRSPSAATKPGGGGSSLRESWLCFSWASPSLGGAGVALRPRPN